MAVMIVLVGAVLGFFVAGLGWLLGLFSLAMALVIWTLSGPLAAAFVLLRAAPLADAPRTSERAAPQTA